MPEDELEASQDTGTGAEEIPVATETQEIETPEGGDSLNPAWNELMEVLPSSLHNLAKPHLQKWDQNFQTKINEVHSQYAPYKSYLDNQIAPENINYALQLMEKIETEPAVVIKALTEYAKANGITLEEAAQEVKETAEQGQVDESEIPNDLLNHPEFVRMKQLVETMAQTTVAQQQKAEQDAMDAQLQNEFAELHKNPTYGDFDEDWVLTKAIQAANAGKKVDSLEPFVQEYKAFEQSVLAKARKPAPKVLAPGGIAPDNQLDVKKLDGKGRRELIAQTLATVHQNSQ